MRDLSQCSHRAREPQLREALRVRRVDRTPKHASVRSSMEAGHVPGVLYSTASNLVKMPMHFRVSTDDANVATTTSQTSSSGGSSQQRVHMDIETKEELREAV